MRAWAQDFEALLAVYRSQRAWKLMLAARKGYSLLISGGWKALPQFLVWMARLVSGRPAGLQEFELQFPQPKDYLR